MNVLVVKKHLCTGICRVLVVVAAVVLVVLVLNTGAIAAADVKPGKAGAVTGTIAYVRDDEIRLIEPDGHNDRRLWTHGLADPNDVYDITGLAWRPDAAELAFASSHENWCSLNHSDLFAVAADGSNYRRITESPSCSSLAGHPQGTVQIPVQNSSILGDSFVGFVYFQGAGSAQQVSLPPGGSTVLTFNNVADLGDFPQVATMIVGENREISFATAIDVLAGQSVTAGTMDVYVPSGFWEVRAPTWRSDGSKVGYVLNFASLRQISPTPTPLDFGEELQTDESAMPDFANLLDWGPATRPNDLLYVGNAVFDSEGVYLVEAGAATAGEKLVSYEVYEDIRGLAWLPDGSGFIYSVEESEFFESVRANLFSYTFATRQVKRLTNFEDEFAGILSVSPDGQRIVFERSTAEEDGETDLWIINRDGTGLELLVANGRAPAWSPQDTQTPPPSDLQNFAYVPALLR